MKLSKPKLLAGVAVAATSALLITAGAYAWTTNSGGGSATVTVAVAGPTVAPDGSVTGNVFPGKADSTTVVIVTNNQNRPIHVSRFLAGTNGAIGTCPANSVGTAELGTDPGPALVQTDGGTTDIPPDGGIGAYYLVTHFNNLLHNDDPVLDAARDQNGCLGTSIAVDLSIDWDFSA